MRPPVGSKLKLMPILIALNMGMMQQDDVHLYKMHKVIFIPSLMMLMAT